MKANKLMIAALAMGAMMFVACNNEPKVDPPVVDPGTQTETTDVEPTAGKITIVINFADAPCNDVVLAGGYAGNTAWTSSEFQKMEKIDEHNYKIVIDPNAEANEGGFVAEAKPVQLDEDGKFSWDGQWYGTVAVVDGSCDLDYNDGNGESQMRFTEEAVGTTVKLSAEKWKTKICGEALPVATVAYIKFAPDWTWAEMTKTAEGTFTYELTWTENGVNINIEGSDTGAAWYPVEDIKGMDGIASGDAVVATFVSKAGPKGTVTFAKK